MPSSCSTGNSESLAADGLMPIDQLPRGVDDTRKSTDRTPSEERCARDTISG